MTVVAPTPVRTTTLCLACAFLLPGTTLAKGTGPETRQQAEVQRQATAMGTRLQLSVVAADRPTALAASEAALRAIEAAEARLSTWRDDSELARLNHMEPGQPFRPSPALAATLARTLYWSAETSGAFQPQVAPLVEAWALRRGGRLPTGPERADALAACAADAFLFDLPERVLRLHPQAGVEEGGFGKGAALDEAAAALLQAGATRAWFDFGGQTLVVGEDPTGTPDATALADPRDRSRGVLALDLCAGSTATSGNSERGVTVDGRRLGHILDPRTGQPAADFGSLTVCTPGALDADCLSTGLYVLGPEAALAFAGARPSLEVIVIETRGEGLRVRATSGLRGRLTSLAEGLDVEWHPATAGAPDRTP